jgi:GcrA cell cycle regulator
MANRNTSAWPAEKDAMLIKLWEEGLAVSKIGEAMGITKNAVVGRAHRLEERNLLERRKSPIIREYARSNKPKSAPRVSGPTLPVLASATTAPNMHENAAMFTHMWNDGASYKKLSATFGISQSNVNNWRARLKLPPRFGHSAPTAVPPLPSQPSAPPVMAPPKVQHFGLQIAPMPRPAPAAPMMPRKLSGRMTCQSVQGKSGIGLDFQVHFCGKPVMLRRDETPLSYCPEHCARYYAPASSRTPGARAFVPFAPSERQAPSRWLVEES